MVAIQYDEKIAEEICDTIASCTEGLKELCKQNPHWPKKNTIYKWMHKNPDFREKYLLAKEHQIQPLVDEILEIADDISKDTIVKYDRDGNEHVSCNSEWVNRSRLRIDSRKWLAAKLMPKMYGEKNVDKTPVSDSLMEKLIDRL